MNRLKELREKAGMNMKEAAAALGYKYMTYVNYEKENRQLNSEEISHIANYYGVTADYVLGRNIVYLRTELDEKYDRLDEAGKAVVDAVIDLELQRCSSVVEKPKAKVIPLFAAAAGPGEPARDEFDEYEVDEKSPAQFAVKISGDSMEPELRDGDIVLCQRRKPKTGELAVIMVNGFLYVKQYIDAYAGNIYLRSLNRARKDCDVDILASGNDTVTGYGTVIHKHLDLVEQ